MVVSAFIASVTLLQAAPTGGVVTSGTASIAQSGSVTNITQTTQKAAINWQNFSIGATETVNFNQPNVSSITLNRVVGNEKSIIDGALNANGQVFILNSNGLLFSKNASINTAGLVATTMNLSDTDFMNGNYAFKGDSTASIINQGRINISDKGYAALFGKEVINEGIIKATLGKVHVTGASEVTLNLNGNSLVNLTVNKGVLDALVENKGAIYADGGEVYLTTNAVNELLRGVVNNTGIIEAKTLDDITGKIVLFAHGGTGQFGGTLSTGKGEGFIETSGKEFVNQADLKVETGEWLIDPVNITINQALADTIQTALGSADVTITTAGNNTPSTATGEDATNTPKGDIYFNGNLSWSVKTLILRADHDIWISGALTGTGTAKLGLEYGQSMVADPIYPLFNITSYTILGSVSLPTNSFYAKYGTDGSTTLTNLPTFLNNGFLRFGNGTMDSVTALGTLLQPFYYDDSSKQWYKLTYVDYSLVANVGIGGSAYADGTVINTAANTAAASFTSTTTDTSAFANGHGSLVSTTTVTVGSDIVQMENTYSLQAGESFLKTTTKLTNTQASPATNVRFWTGANDDWIRTTDSPTKTRGNLSDTGFTAITDAATQAKALTITTGNLATDSGVLFFSTLPTAEVLISNTASVTCTSNCGRTSNFSSLTATGSPITLTGDNSYAIYGNLGTLAQGASAQMVWYYAAGNVGNLGTIATAVNAVADVIPVPAPPVTTPTQDLTPIITQIVNNTAIQPPVMPNFAPPQAPPSQQFSFGGQQVQIMSTPSGGAPTQVVSMQELRQMQQDGSNGGNPTGDIRVPLMTGSLIDLVNGGVRLPIGVDQEFFILAQN